VSTANVEPQATGFDIDAITARVGRSFLTFGGGQTSEFNPIVTMLAEQPFQFAAGVSVRDVVIAVLKEAAASDLLEAAEAARKYDEAIHRRGLMGNVTPAPAGLPGALAQGDDLDALYLDWQKKATAAIAKVNGSQPERMLDPRRI